MRRAITALVLFLLVGAVPVAAFPAARAAQDATPEADAATTGLPTVRWTFRGDQPNLGEEGQPLHAGADGVVYVDGRDQRLHALDAETGETRWRAEGAGDFLIAAGDTVYVSVREFGPQPLAALDSATGAERWRRQTGAPIQANRLAADEQSMYVVDSTAEGEHALLAIDAATGDDRWRIAIAGDNAQFSEPAIADGLLFVSGSETPEAPLWLSAIDTFSGQVRWEHRADVPFEATWVELIDGTAFVHLQSTTGRPGELHVLDAATGEERWRRTTPTAGDVFSPVALAGGAVLVTDVDGERGNVYALDAANGEERWRFATRPMGSYRLPVDDGVVYVGDQAGGFFALDAATGRELGRFSGASEFRQPLVAGNTVYADDVQGRLFAFSAGTASARWQTDIDVPADLSVVGDIVYAQSTRYLHAIDAATGRLLWRVRTGVGLVCKDPQEPLTTDGTVVVGGPEGDVLALEPPTAVGGDALAPLSAVHGGTLVDLVVGAVPAAPAFVGIWRMTVEPNATLRDDPFSAGAAVYAVEFGVLRVETPVNLAADEPEVASGDMVAGDGFTIPQGSRFAARNEREFQVEILVGAVVPAGALPPRAVAEGVTLDLLAGGEATVLPTANPDFFQMARMSLDWYLLEPGNVLPPTLPLLPEVLLLEGLPGDDDANRLELSVAAGAIGTGPNGAETVEAGSTATILPGEGALLPTGSLTAGRYTGDFFANVTVLRVWIDYTPCASGCGRRCLGGRY